MFNVNESPNHFMILDAMGGRDMTNINNIAKVTKLNNKIELIVNDLFNQRLIVKIETLGSRKKTKIRITQTGLTTIRTKIRADTTLV